ncbi:hypothetical protein C2869_12205 [Saccharobesus litoralis]|uniref:VWFA domain-containing protein n=1 Tax=Saccharobesus litoralis TaxID=2172099 RepID=A0A2S0VSS0_9ALTE|nr:VWA domain-containing protein [Saccharobesus litoralis]AWB67150.1 hypothetical protein C2869_12205 [Saccharobesus litoralis]
MAEFHFIRPWWLLTLIPLMVLAWQLKRVSIARSGWQGVIPNHLLRHVLDKKASQQAIPRWLIAFVWIIVTIALAGPTWQRLPQPVFQAQAGKIVLLDMSMSMRSTDIKPDRLSRARFKVMELIDQITEGDLGLVVYAGDAFTISPLTPDNNNLLTLIPSLSPEIMPVQGSTPIVGLEHAVKLLQDAGYAKGDIVWITDGIRTSDMSELGEFVQQNPYRLLTLGIGTANGAPIKMANGDLLKDHTGAIVIPKLDARLLQKISSLSGGYYMDMTADDSDIQTLVKLLSGVEDVKLDEDQQEVGDQWQEMGPWLVLFILPFAAYAFRRGVIYSLIPVLLILQPASEVMANQTPTTAPAAIPNEETGGERNEDSEGNQPPATVETSWWNDLWQTRDQQGQQAFANQDYSSAAQLFEDAKWQAASQFKQGNYEAAAQTLADYKDPDSLYNKGNALANLGKLDEAIQAYDEALQQRPDFQQAKDNKALAEQLKQQQKQQQQNGENQEQNGEQDQQNSDQQEGQQNGQQDQQQNSEQQDGQQSQNQQAQNDQQQGEQQDSQSNEDSAEQSEQEQQAQQSAGEESEEEQSEEQQAQQAQEESAEEQNAEQQAQARELTEEERANQEQQQVIQKLLNKVEDDPAFLLRRKMQLEARQRKRFQPPTGANQSW